MSAATVSFLTNDNALTVVNAYLMAMDETPFEDQVKLVHAVLYRYRPCDVAKLLDIPVQRIYEYRRDDWVKRHAARYAKTNVLIKDFVKILMLGNMDA